MIDPRKVESRLQGDKKAAPASFELLGTNKPMVAAWTTSGHKKRPQQAFRCGAGLKGGTGCSFAHSGLLAWYGGWYRVPLTGGNASGPDTRRASPTWERQEPWRLLYPSTPAVDCRDSSLTRQTDRHIPGLGLSPGLFCAAERPSVNSQLLGK
jgi:hypothetical protein